MKSKQAYPECVPNAHETVPIAHSQMVICIGALLGEVWDCLTGIHEENELYDSLSRIENAAFDLREIKERTDLRVIKRSRKL